ncbi:type 1 glutamine amidotransferase [Gordonia sp. ABSL49_1]|uniref:type 1 glutamine amidotransferase n=1 Tax=unclassified Gordonia (in: high G+C Gram-positive bacteria) TaxID=2657482 RepID=UPI001F0DD564|nr:type 1 glutamine amidotransferase [Gordonia sp. ABSL49_1]MCH5643567.1 type 1 glutamine amidotransferase [Gordonia sp. ABSL49_1]
MSSERLRVLELRHAETEPPGAYSPALDDLADVTTVRVWREPLPGDLGDVDAIVVMGGAMGVGDAGSLPWLAKEIDFLREAHERGVPIWGVCLGAQLLAAALGARVTRAETPELGVHRVVLTEEGRRDPVWSATPGHEFSTVQWHFDTFALPPGAVLLGSSHECPRQIYRLGASYGVQFHIEAGESSVREWLSGPDSYAAVAAAIGDDATAAFADAAGEAEARAGALADAVMRRWLTGIRRRG